MEEKKNTKNVQSLVETAGTITGSFNSLKIISITSVIVACLTAAVCVFYSLYVHSQNQRQVFVLDRGQVLTASSQDVSLSLRDRIEFQAKSLHRLLFTVTPNKDVVTANINEALEISDRSVYEYYQTLNEKGFYRRMFQANASQDIRVDSVRVDMSTYPYRVATFATLTNIRESSLQRSVLVTRCRMIEVNMNRKNREGLQIEEFTVVSNDELESRRR